MRVEMVDVQSILFQKGCCQFCCIIFRLLIRRIVRRGHNTLDGNGSSVAVPRTVSGVPAAQTVGQILPCTHVIHIIMNSHVLHVVIDGCPCVLFRRGRSACYGDPVCVVNCYTDNFALHGNRGHINVVGIMFVSKYSLTVTPPNVVVASGLKIVILLVLLVGGFFCSADFCLQNINCFFDCGRIRNS